MFQLSRVHFRALNPEKPRSPSTLEPSQFKAVLETGGAGRGGGGRVGGLKPNALSLIKTEP